MLNGLAGKTAVLQGLGSDLAKECLCVAARAGMHLVLVDADPAVVARAQTLAQGLGAATVLPAAIAVGDALAMEALAQQVQAQWGAPHWLLNLPATAPSTPVWRATAAQWQQVLEANLWPVVHSVRCLTPLMLAAAARDAQWQGHIVNTAGMAGMLCGAHNGLLHTSQHAVAGLTEALHHDLQQATTQLHCSLWCPPADMTYAGRHGARHRRSAVSPHGAPAAAGQASPPDAVMPEGMGVEDMVSKMFAAVADNQFYVLGDRQASEHLHTRMEDMTELRNPTAVLHR